MHRTRSKRKTPKRIPRRRATKARQRTTGPPSPPLLCGRPKARPVAPSRAVTNRLRAPRSPHHLPVQPNSTDGGRLPALSARCASYIGADFAQRGCEKMPRREHASDDAAPFSVQVSCCSRASAAKRGRRRSLARRAKGRAQPRFLWLEKVQEKAGFA